VSSQLLIGWTTVPSLSVATRSRSATSSIRTRVARLGVRSPVSSLATVERATPALWRARADSCRHVYGPLARGLERTLPSRMAAAAVAVRWLPAARPERVGVVRS
jgi:hypothetical protein